ncbi:MAG: KpsF/GutQ family sugar-phosphate isomerase [Alphaproteobacteria bacterium]|nr:KpsF/GutQ family sugar-phosphate isomerase [Alphaproteobacteria bacterium]
MLNKKNAALASAHRTLAAERAGLEQLDASLGAAFEAVVEKIAALNGRLIVSGMGKSGHIAAKITATMASTGTPAHYVHPGEASHGDLGMIAKQDIVLALSWSGETAEWANILAYVKRFNIPLIAMTANPDSTLGQAADICLALPKAKEACPNGLAPTTSTTIQLALGDALAIALLERRGFTASDFKAFHPGGNLGASLTTISNIMHTGRALPLVEEQVKMAEALVIMTAKGFGCLGVTKADGQICGIITDGDLRRHMGKDMLDKPASAIMTSNPKTIHANMIAAEALNLMNENKIQSLFICENNIPQGFIHLHDLLRLGVA